jgi:mannosyltransferase
MLQVLPEFPDFTAIICGLCQPTEQAFKQTILNKIAEHDLGSRIIFLGDLPLDEIPVWYRNVTIMVACPRYEPFGITPLEAMASGCAVIASRTGAFEHIVKEGETGLLVPTNNIDALANALRELMSNPDKAIAMGKLGRQRVAANFSIEKEAREINTIYTFLHE